MTVHVRQVCRRLFPFHAVVLVASMFFIDGLVGGENPMAPKSGDLVFKTDFDSPTERDAWSRSGFDTWITDYKNTTSLCITVPVEHGPTGAMVHLPLDLAQYRGSRLLFECQAKANQVTQPEEPWLGVKFMLHYISKETGPHYQNENGVFGSFDWRKLNFTALISPDATNGQISLGLQGSSGKVMFDEIKITVFKGPPPKRPAPPLNPGPVFKGHNLPRLRGVMSPSTFREDDLKELGLKWNANVIRWQITRNWGRAGTDRDLDEYDRWLGDKLDELERVLDASRRYGLMVVVDMHSPPGGRHKNMDLAIFHEPAYQNHYVALWRKIAKRFKGHPSVWGYDLVNEPVQNLPPPAGVADYLGTQVLAARAIREVDHDVPIFIEASQWDSAEGFRELRPVDIPNVIYQVHMYVPSEFTHQGVHNKKTGIAYPGVIGGKNWNKAELRKTLAPVREFQLAYNVHIYVGEFSAIRWAPGAADYLRDCIDVFEEYDWDWTYHAFREWDGWSVEHSGDRNKTRTAVSPTDRQKLLLEWFSKNQQPIAQ